MRINRSYLLTTMYVFFLSMSACKHDAPEPLAVDQNQEQENSIVTFLTILPPNGANFGAGQAVPIFVEAEAEQTLHGYDVYLMNLTDNGDTVLKVNQHDHRRDYLIEEEWINDVTQDSDMQIDVHIRINHEGDSEVKTMLFRCRAS